jgi:hypothetical protein
VVGYSHESEEAIERPDGDAEPEEAVEFAGEYLDVAEGLSVRTFVIENRSIVGTHNQSATMRTTASITCTTRKTS